MAEYVDIKTSPADIIGIANRLRNQGVGLESRMKTHTAHIRTQEGRGETFPSDRFTDEFLKIYHSTTKDIEGADVTVNVAVTTSAVGLGTRMTAIGDLVADAMWNYMAADEEGGAEIRAVHPR